MGREQEWHSWKNPYIAADMRRITVLLLLLLLGCLLHAQVPAYRIYDLDDGLPGNNVYAMVQDTAGFLWIATEYGVARFDGKSFQVFSLQDGLGDNEITTLVADPSGHVWFQGYNGSLSWWDGDRIQAVDIPPLVRSVYMDPMGRLEFRTNKNYYRCDPDSGVKVVRPYPLDLNVKERAWTYFLSSGPGASQPPMQGTCVLPFGELIGSKDHPEVYLIRHRQEFFGKGESVFPIRGIPEVTQEANIFDFIRNQEGQIILATSKGLVFAELQQDSLVFQERHFTDFSFNALYMDHEGNIWAATRKHGLVFLPHSGLVNYFSDELPVFALARTREGKLWWGSDKGRMGTFGPQGLQKKTGIDVGNREKFMDLRSTSDGRLIGVTDRIFWLDGKEALDRLDYLGTAKSICSKSSEEWYIGTGKGVYLLQASRLDSLRDVEFKNLPRFLGPVPPQISLKAVIPDRTHGLVYDAARNLLYAGTNTGLVIYDGQTSVRPQHPFLRQRILHLALTDQGVVVISTSGLGVILFRGGR